MTKRFVYAEQRWLRSSYTCMLGLAYQYRWIDVKRGFTTGADCLWAPTIQLYALCVKRSTVTCLHEAEIAP